MTDLDARFKQAADEAQQLPERPDNDTILKLYALYKQGSQGDVAGDKPGFFDFIGVAKYEAWEKCAGMPQDEAKQKYIELVDSLKG
ncbi:MAG: acyl-CoA-binding protein [Wenzhouxiangella sp.]